MKKLHLRREVLTELTDDQMRIVAAGTITYTCVPQSVATACGGGQSCVCSIGAQCTNTCGCTRACMTGACGNTLLCIIDGS